MVAFPKKTVSDPTMKRLSSIITLFIFTLGVAQAQVNGRTVLVNVDVLTMESLELEMNQVIIVEGDIIAGVLDESLYDSLDGDEIVDGGGGVVVPGLIDAHVHLDHPQDVQLYPLYGVTTVINMRGLPWHLRLRYGIREGIEFGPDFITSGDYLDGYPPDMLPMSSVAGEDAARAAVRAQREAGFDFIKVYSELSQSQYQAVCEEALGLGIGVLGHVPDAVSLQDLLNCPQINIAHGEQLFKLLNSREDLAEIQRLISAIAETGLTYTANLDLYGEMAKQPAQLEQLTSRSESELIHPATFQPWRPGINRYARRDTAWVARVEKVVVDLEAIIRETAEIDAAVLIAGSDSPVAGAYPGESLIAELEALQRAGLDSFTALSAATTHAARLIGRLVPDFPEVGVIRAGARADLVLLASNPLDDFDVLRSPRAVMLRGDLVFEEKLSEMRDRLVAATQAATERVRALESLVFSGDMEAAYELFLDYRGGSPEEILFAQYPFFFFGFGWLYGESGLTQDAGDAEKAVLLYDMYRQTYPEFHSAHHVYGLALEAAGDIESAIVAQQRALAILPQYQPAIEAINRLQSE